MLRVGLTGGIASGKTTVADQFAGLGAGVVDTDRVARDVVRPGEAGLAAVAEAFGPGILSASGELDRGTLRAVVFADPGQRRRLEAILHPLIRARTLQQLDRLSAPYAVVVVPLLLETGFGSLVDRVVVVDCARETQLARLLARDGIDPAQAEAMLNAQVDRQTRLAGADDVIDNGGDPACTRERVRTLHARYIELADGWPRGSDCRTAAGRGE